MHRHGEYSGKDYEAVISRAMLVKPLARHLQSYPDIYDVNVTCVEARPCSDLPGDGAGQMVFSGGAERWPSAQVARLAREGVQWSRVSTSELVAMHMHTSHAHEA